MTAMSTAVSASMLSHGLHYVLVLAGLWGLAALLLPHGLTRFGAPPPTDEHSWRVAELRAALASGAVGTAPAQTLTRPRPAPVAGAVWLPLALVASAAAAGTHAAVAPAHLAEEVAAGGFLLAAAIAQLAWAVAALRPTPALLRLGLVLQLALVATWAASRTAGLPFGLQADPHPVGPWDLTCVAWELTAVVACARTLHDGVPARCPAWSAWHPSTRTAVGLAAAVLVLLTSSGAHA
ncbi:hypothetical protein [Nocardioides rubriscoriae]|uniref:hypothetical protein n=1 Tax=Nocardioides rubriscoriae TaxID=642762 RepID=UPI0011E06A57|nr:hypothetical protein [Nocardioides rubriscoriae]